MDRLGEPRRLLRSRTDQHIAGVCGGLAGYLGVEATWVRLGFALLTLINGAGLLLYIVLALIIPKEPVGQLEPTPTQPSDVEQTLREGAQNLQERAEEVSQRMRDGRGSGLLGWALVAVGGWFLLRETGLLRLDEGLVFPLLLIGIGVLVLLRRAER